MHRDAPPRLRPSRPARLHLLFSEQFSTSSSFFFCFVYSFITALVAYRRFVLGEVLLLFFFAYAKEEGRMPAKFPFTLLSHSLQRYPVLSFYQDFFFLVFGRK